MSGGKQAIYQRKILGADGLNRAIMIGGGDGNPTTGAGPVAMLDGYWAMADAAATLSAGQHGGAITMTPGAGRALTVLTGAELDAAFPSLPIGANWSLHLVNLAAATHALTLTGATGVTVRGGAVAAAASATFKFIKTAAATYIVSPA